MSIKTCGVPFLKRSATIVLAGTTICCSIIVFASERIFRQSMTAALAEPARTTTASDSQQNRVTVVETELITVTRHGFEPENITRPEGKFILMVENRTWQNLTLRFLRGAGESLHEVTASREKPDWNEVQDLRPGRYVLTALNHPDWECVVTITTAR